MLAFRDAAPPTGAVAPVMPVTLAMHSPASEATLTRCDPWEVQPCTSASPVATWPSVEVAMAASTGEPNDPAAFANVAFAFYAGRQ
eukprot:11213531-Lingulodinium_polyedra.AAC.1